jgi:hypothetical protein
MSVDNVPQRVYQVATRDIDETEAEEPELIASEVDELTHAELLCLYRNTEENIRFSKLIQWRTMGGTLAVFVCVVLLARHYSKDGDMTRVLTILTFVVGATSIYMLAIFQSWQGIEREKIQLILSKLSNFARDVYDTKSALAANIERFILLGIMCTAILSAGFLTLARLLRWLPG